jgi:hypothetical protein
MDAAQTPGGEKPYRTPEEAALKMIHEFAHSLKGRDEAIPKAAENACNWPVNLGALVGSGIL